MKPYGVPRDPELDGGKDVATIKTYGLNKSAGGKDYFKNKDKKARIRRFWKKKARRSLKKFNIED